MLFGPSPSPLPIRMAFERLKLSPLGFAVSQFPFPLVIDVTEANFSEAKNQNN
jgi:hypothetical protein